MEKRYHKNRPSCITPFDDPSNFQGYEPTNSCIVKYDIGCKPQTCKKVCKPACQPVCETPCKKKCKKRCSSSSSSSSSEKCRPCVPRCVYQSCSNCGVQSLELAASVVTPNGTTAPYTYLCPDQIGQKIYITFTVTNTGNTSIHGPIYIYDSFTGVHKFFVKKLSSGDTAEITVKNKITKCDCSTGSNINIVANAYTYVHKQCLILVSQPIAINITRTT